MDIFRQLMTEQNNMISAKIEASAENVKESLNAQISSIATSIDSLQNKVSLQEEKLERQEQQISEMNEKLDAQSNKILFLEVGLRKKKTLFSTTLMKLLMKTYKN